MKHFVKNASSLLAVALVLLSVAPAHSQEHFGEEMAPRAWGLGGAFVGLADDLSAVFWNPAGLGRLRGTHLWGRLSLPATETPYEISVFALGGSLGYLGGSAWYGQRRWLRLDSPNNTEEEALTLLAMGVALNELISAGATVKLYDQQQAGRRWQGTGFDLGGLLRWGRLIQGGLVITDLLGTQLKPAEGGDPIELPRVVRMGALLRLWEERWLVSAAVDLAQQEELRRIRLGTELRFWESLAVRIGWNGRELAWGAGAGIWGLLQAEFAAQSGGWAFSLEIIFGGL